MDDARVHQASIHWRRTTSAEPSEEIPASTVSFRCRCGASGSGLDKRYLRKRPRLENWSKLKFPIKKPSSSNFVLWKLAIRQVVPTAGLAVRLEKFLHDGYKIWEWRHCPEAQHLVHILGGTMDVYVPASSLHGRWKKAPTGCDIEEIGRPCSERKALVIGWLLSPSHY